MNKISLFSGIGGDDIASDWAGIKTVCFVENNPYCQKVLRKHWPDTPIIGDVKDVTKEKIMEYASRQSRWAETEGRLGVEGELLSKGRWSEDTDWTCPSSSEPITLISGGFPCQPHSVAGKREGSADERNLWPEFRRIIGEIKPRWVLAENVPGLFTSDARRFFGTILADLAEMGYSTGWATYGAVDVGALHRRNRVFIVGYSTSNGSKTGFSGQEQGEEGNTGEPINRSQDVADTEMPHRRRTNGEDNSGRWHQEAGGQSIPTRGEEYWAVERRLGESANGLPGRLDCNWGEGWEDGIPRVIKGQKNRVDRLKGLGNAVVPQQVYPIYRAIMEIEHEAT